MFVGLNFNDLGMVEYGWMDHGSSLGKMRLKPTMIC